MKHLKFTYLLVDTDTGEDYSYPIYIEDFAPYLQSYASWGNFVRVFNSYFDVYPNFPLRAYGFSVEYSSVFPFSSAKRRLRVYHSNIGVRNILKYFDVPEKMSIIASFQALFNKYLFNPKNF